MCVNRLSSGLRQSLTASNCDTAETIQLNHTSRVPRNIHFTFNSSIHIPYGPHMALRLGSMSRSSGTDHH